MSRNGKLAKQNSKLTEALTNLKPGSIPRNMKADGKRIDSAEGSGKRTVACFGRNIVKLQIIMSQKRRKTTTTKDRSVSLVDKREGKPIITINTEAINYNG